MKNSKILKNSKIGGGLRDFRHCTEKSTWVFLKVVPYLLLVVPFPAAGLAWMDQWLPDAPGWRVRSCKAYEILDGKGEGTGVQTDHKSARRYLKNL